MEKYLLNLETGVICIDGTSENDVVVECELIESILDFKLIGEYEGKKIVATLSRENYFEGKEFIVDTMNGRILEGERHLQSYGKRVAIQAKNLRVGDVMMWNWGEVSTVKSIEFTKSGKSLKVIEEYRDVRGELKESTRTFRCTRLVAVASLVHETKEDIYTLSETELNNVITNITESMNDCNITNIYMEDNCVLCDYISKYQTKCSTGLYGASEGIKNAMDLEQVYNKLIEVYNPSNYKITSETTDENILNAELNLLESRLKKVNEFIELNSDNERARQSFRDLENQIKYEYGAISDILEKVKNNQVEPKPEVNKTLHQEIKVNQSSNIEVIEEKENNIDDVKVVLNDDKNGVELYFNSKPNEEVRNNLKSNGFKWSRFNKCWYAKQSDNTLNFANSFNNLNYEELEQNSKEYLECKEKELQIKVNEININDIESYIVPYEISKTENENSFFRSKETNHTKVLQNVLSEANEEVLKALESTNNINTKYRLLTALQSFKNNYTNAYIDYLRFKGSNPSWMITGRAGRNINQDNKKNNIQNNKLFKLNEITEKYNSILSKCKSSIKKEIKLNQEKEINSISVLPKFNRIKIEINPYELNIFNGDNKQLKQVSEYQGYYIFKNWACYRVYDNKGNEIFSTKTTDKLDVAKKWLINYLNKK